MARFALVCLLVALPPSTASSMGRGDQMLWQCKGRATSEAEGVMGQLVCAAYISGFIDSYQLTTAAHRVTPVICLPPSGISNDQGMRIVTKYLEAHPEDLHESARSSVFLALREAFPCEQ